MALLTGHAWEGWASTDRTPAGRAAAGMLAAKTNEPAKTAWTGKRFIRKPRGERAPGGATGAGGPSTRRLKPKPAPVVKMDSCERLKLNKYALQGLPSA